MIVLGIGKTRLALAGLGFQERTQDRERSTCRAIGVVQERVKLDRQPAVVSRGRIAATTSAKSMAPVPGTR